MFVNARAACALWAGVLALAACGGKDAEPPTTNDSDAATSYRAFVASLPAAVAPPPQPEPADRLEAAARSRDWAVAAVMDAAPARDSNVITVPPLYFARAQLVVNAARGETLSALTSQVSLPGSTAVWAGLLEGVDRTLNAAPDALFTGDFLRAAGLVGVSDIWSIPSLGSLSAASLAEQPNLRLEVVDTVFLRLPWPAASRHSAVYTYADGRRALVDLLRVQGAITVRNSPGYLLKALALPGQPRLLQITPHGPIGAWGAVELARALDESIRVEATPQAGEMVLALGSLGAGVGVDDRQGLGLAQDKLSANLSGLDGLGGTYTEFSSSSVQGSIDADALNFGGSQTTRFIFNPLNVHGSAGSISTIVTFPASPDCTQPPAEIAPHFLAVVTSEGSLLMLSRVALISGQQCISFIVRP